MKNIFLSFAVIISFLAISCKKDNNNQTAPAAEAPVSIDVEYKILSESGNVEASYMFPNSNGSLEIKTETITRADHSVSFKSTKGNFFSLQAWNTIAARKAVYVQIYINGVLFQEGSCNSPSQKAVASGNY
jgi:hypothetical protein